MSHFHLYSSVEIYNMALARCGLISFIDLFTDQSVEAMIGKDCYQSVLERVLEEFPWPFATKFLTLTEYVPPVPTVNSLQWHIDWWGGVGQTDVNLAPKVLPDGWQNVYEYPSDCLFVKSIWSGQYPVGARGRIPFRAVDNGLSQYDVVLFVNKADASMEYISIPAGLEDVTRGPVGDGGLVDTRLNFDDGTLVGFDDGVNVEAL